MNHFDMLLTISNLTVADFKRMQKALRLLLSIGLMQDTALDLILRGLKDKQVERDKNKHEIRQAR